MRNTLFILFLVATFSLTAQNNNESTNSVDLIFGMDRSFRHLPNQGDNGIASIASSVRNDYEIPSLSYRFGLNYNQKLSKKLFFKTGIRFLKTGYETEKTELIFLDALEPTFGIPKVDFEPGNEESLKWVKFKYRFFSFEFPIHLKFVLVDKKIDLYLESGISPYLLVNHNTKLITNLKKESNKDEMTEFRTLDFIGTIGAGFQKDLTQNIQIFSQANFRYHILGTTVDTPVKEHQHQLGLELGARFSLKGFKKNSSPRASLSNN